MKLIFCKLGNYYKQLLILFISLITANLVFAEGSPSNPNDLPPPPGGIPDAMQVLNRIADQIPQLTGLVNGIVFLIGLGFIIGGLMKLKHFGEQRTMMSGHHSWGSAVLFLFIGALLLFLPSTIEVGTSTFFSTPCLDCYPTAADSPFTAFFKVVYAVVGFVGLIAFVRGLIILSHVGEQSQHGTLARAMTHIIAGILCMNIGAFVQTIFATLGIQM